METDSPLSCQSNDNSKTQLSSLFCSSGTQYWQTSELVWPHKLYIVWNWVHCIGIRFRDGATIQNLAILSVNISLARNCTTPALALQNMIMVKKFSNEQDRRSFTRYMENRILFFLLKIDIYLLTVSLTTDIYPSGSLLSTNNFLLYQIVNIGLNMNLPYYD